MHSHDACYKRRRNSWYDITHSGRVAPFIAAPGTHTHFYTSNNRHKNTSYNFARRKANQNGRSQWKQEGSLKGYKEVRFYSRGLQKAITTGLLTLMNEDGCITTKPELVVPMTQLQAKTVIVSTQNWRIKAQYPFCLNIYTSTSHSCIYFNIKLINFTLLYTDYLQWRSTCILHSFIHSFRSPSCDRSTASSASSLLRKIMR
jgi:hypothetical protein